MSRASVFAIDMTPHTITASVAPDGDREGNQYDGLFDRKTGEIILHPVHPRE